MTDLQNYIAQSTGATLPFVSESELPDGAKAIYVGETAKTAALGKDLDAVFEDGFYLTTDGENLSQSSDGMKSSSVRSFGTLKKLRIALPCSIIGAE